MIVKHNEQGNYPCRVKECQYKKRNGRCSLELITFSDAGKCISYRYRLSAKEIERKRKLQ